MDDPTLTPALRELHSLAEEVARTEIAPESERVDRDAVWPRHAIDALARAGLMGLHVPREHGGRGQGLYALALVTEEIGRACPSSGLVYGMHCVASKVIEAKATPDQAERYLRPIADGRHVTSLALSEPGTGVHFYLPRATFEAVDDEFVLEGTKSFVTSGGEADSYVVSVVGAGGEMDPGTFSAVLVDRDAPGLAWQQPWQGVGMRGNSSRTVQLERVRVPAANLLGEQGDEVWYMFEVIVPYFLVAMASVYVGVARAALDRTIEHLRGRTYAHTGESVAHAPVVTHRLGELWAGVERARQLVHHAARAGDAGASDARRALFACKAEVARTVVWVTNEAMTLTGGRSYGANSELARLLRDARASEIMAPSTQLLNIWLGRTLLELPLL